jgi:hypothetical protein
VLIRVRVCLPALTCVLACFAGCGRHRPRQRTPPHGSRRRGRRYTHPAAPALPRHAFALDGSRSFNVCAGPTPRGHDSRLGWQELPQASPAQEGGMRRLSGVASGASGNTPRKEAAVQPSSVQVTRPRCGDAL